MTAPDSRQVGNIHGLPEIKRKGYTEMQNTSIEDRLLMILEQTLKNGF